LASAVCLLLSVVQDVPYDTSVILHVQAAHLWSSTVHSLLDHWLMAAIDASAG